MKEELLERKNLKNTIINDALLVHNIAIKALSDALQAVNTHCVSTDSLYEAKSNVELLKKQFDNYSKSKAGVQLLSAC